MRATSFQFVPSPIKVSVSVAVALNVTPPNNLMLPPTPTATEDANCNVTKRPAFIVLAEIVLIPVVPVIGISEPAKGRDIAVLDAIAALTPD